jgi:hypothetical protein
VSLEKALNLTKEQTQISWDIMQQYGNMSSSTILFILNLMRNNLKNEKTCCLVFGPGLVIEGIYNLILFKGCVLKKVENFKQETNFEMFKEVTEKKINEINFEKLEKKIENYKKDERNLKIFEFLKKISIILIPTIITSSLFYFRKNFYNKN